jgi:hypothetical protein
MEGVRYALLVLAIVCFVLAAARVQASIDFVPAGFALVVGAWVLDELNMRVSPP